jgi:hypothetical protein
MPSPASGDNQFKNHTAPNAPTMWVAIFLVEQVLGATVGAVPPRAKTRVGSTVRWLEPEIVLHPVNPASGAAVSIDDLREAIHAAAQAWNDAMGNCEAPRLRIGAALHRDARVRPDRVDVEKVRTQAWCPYGALDP